MYIWSTLNKNNNPSQLEQVSMLIGKNTVVDLFHSLSLGKLKDVEPVAQSGSDRQYFRLITQDSSFIGMYSENIKENDVFRYFSECLFEKGISVPQVLGVNNERTAYIQNDCGSECLLDFIQSNTNDRYSIIEYYKRVVKDLVQIQLVGGQVVNFDRCLTVSNFGSQQILADLNYFKYYFFRLSGFFKDEHLLDREFQKLAGDYAHSEPHYFMFRDFQSRNIMLKDGRLSYIDFQGGMNGPLQYDLASLLYQAKAGLSDDERTELLSFYLSELENHTTVDKRDFIDRFYMILLIRVLQTLGAYGFRGFIERKTHFIESIRPALENLESLHSKCKYLHNYPFLMEVVKTISNKENRETICQRIN